MSNKNIKLCYSKNVLLAEQLVEMKFYKYQGAGNDFVMLDGRDETVDLTNEQVAHICDRHFGVGADGLIILENDTNANFKMIYFNSDGHLSTMCGNGGRCIVRFAEHLGLVTESCQFSAVDGMHEANIKGEWIELKMNDVNTVEHLGEDHFLDTGSPHHIVEVDSVEDLNALDVQNTGRELRNSTYHAKRGGSNVNFVVFKPELIHMRTYERGVEAETLACGTGVTAVALLAEHLGKSTGSSCSRIKTRNDELEVSYEKKDSGFTNIWLKGPAERVFSGEINL